MKTVTYIHSLHNTHTARELPRIQQQVAVCTRSGALCE